MSTSASSNVFMKEKVPGPIALVKYALYIKKKRYIKKTCSFKETPHSDDVVILVIVFTLSPHLPPNCTDRKTT